MKTKCSQESCNRKSYRGWLCVKHYLDYKEDNWFITYTFADEILNNPAYIKIPLYGIRANDRFTIVDKENEHLLNYRRHTSSGYAYTRKIGMLHKQVVPNNNPELQIDHINRNPLDNRKENLRLVSRQENVWNSSLQIDNKSGHVWVHFEKSRKQRVAYIRKDYKRYHLWRYNTIEEAIEARKKWEIKYR